MLRTRILTAVVLAPAGIAMIFLAPAWVFRLVIVLLMLIGTWEFRPLAGLQKVPGMGLLALQTFIIALLFLYWPIVTGYAFTILLAVVFSGA